MIKIKQAVVVEGKYDKIKLSSIIDAPIIVTNGFSIFNDKKKLEYIRKVASKRGILIMTDSDNAGFMIRNRIKQAVDKDAQVINVYIPDVLGKEKRKKTKSAEGKLGVEGIDADIIRKSLERFCVAETQTLGESRAITKVDFYEWGISGGENSFEKRRMLLKHLDLPEDMSANALLDAINIFLSYDEFINTCEKLF